MQLSDLIVSSILYFFIPLWLFAGMGDWLCHRITRISETSGLKEALMHLLMLAEIGLPMLLGLFMEINALVIGIMILGFIIHEATVLWDLRYTAGKRNILPEEQIIHSFQELIPLILVTLVIFLHWDQFVALITLSGRADFGLEWKRNPLPPIYLGALLISAGLFVILPFMEETWRCYRYESNRAAKLIAS